MSRRRRQRGVVSVELALITLFIMLLLPPVLFFGHLYWRYNVLQQANHNAARFLSSAPLVELTDPAAVGTVMAGARGLATASGDAVGLPLTANNLVLSCDSCGDKFTAPTVLGVRLKILVTDDVFYDISQQWLASPMIYISSDLQVPYAN